MVPQLRLKTQSKNAERVRAENQYFPHSTLIRRAMGEAYCPTLVELVTYQVGGGDAPQLQCGCIADKMTPICVIGTL